MSLVIEIAKSADRPVVRNMLLAAELPVDDFDQAPVVLWVARDVANLAGAVGLERYGSVGLLRSLVVDSSYRGSGIGRRLVAALEQQAAAAGISQITLRTEQAAPFFEKLGFCAIDRAQAPPVVLRHAQFQSLCPVSAICMTKVPMHPAPEGHRG